MNGESVFGWIKAIVALLLLALIGFLLWKLWNCVSSPLQCLKDALGGIGKYIGGAKLFGHIGAVASGNNAPGQVKTTSPDVFSKTGTGGNLSGCDPRELAAYGNCSSDSPPLRIDICGTSDGACGAANASIIP